MQNIAFLLCCLFIGDCIANRSSDQYLKFFNAAVFSENAENYGLPKNFARQEITFGAEISLGMISSSSNGQFVNSLSPFVFIPVFYNDTIVSLILADRISRHPVALGYHVLALNLNKIIRRYPVEDVTFYQFNGAGLYHFSVSTKGNENLTLISPRWYNSPTVILTDKKSLYTSITKAVLGRFK